MFYRTGGDSSIEPVAVFGLPRLRDGRLVRKEGKTGRKKELRFFNFQAEPGHQCRGSRVDDLFAFGRILLARSQVFAHERLEVVDIVKVNAFQGFGAGIDVAGHSYVD